MRLINQVSIRYPSDCERHTGRDSDRSIRRCRQHAGLFALLTLCLCFYCTEQAVPTKLDPLCWSALVYDAAAIHQVPPAMHHSASAKFGQPKKKRRIMSVGGVSHYSTYAATFMALVRSRDSFLP